MADLAASAVTLVSGWQEGDRSGKYRQKVLDVQVTLATMGSTTNTIPASAFGLTYIREVLASADESTPYGQIQFIPSYDGTLIYAIDLEQATDANRGDPTDVSGNWRFVVKGY